MEAENPTVEFFEAQCAVCYAPMRQVKGGQLRKTCSNLCRQKLYRARQRKGSSPEGKHQARHPLTMPGPPEICPACGGAILQPARGRKRQACSTKCSKKLWRWSNPRCRHCGQHFSRKKDRSRRVYCSASCVTLHHMERKQRAAAARASEARKGGREPAYWWPRPGSGYREEALVMEAGEVEVIRERRPQPWYREDPAEAAARRAAEIAARQAQMVEWEAEQEAERKGRELARQLLGDDPRIWG